METEPAETTEEAPAEEEQRVPYERFDAANRAKKDAEKASKALEKQVADLKKQMDERDQAGLPELEQMKTRLEKAEQRADAAEQKESQAVAQVKRSQSERWVISAAQAQNFADPTDASAFVDLDAIEDEKDAERAVKRLASQKKHLLKTEEPTLPGQVLANGQKAEPQPSQALADAQVLADGLRQFASRE